MPYSNVLYYWNWGEDKTAFMPAVKFFLYTLFGSLLMLVAIFFPLVFFASTVPGGQFTTDLPDLYRIAPALPSTCRCGCWPAFA